MNKLNFLLTGIIILIASLSFSQVSHAKWNALLNKHVSAEGMVDYEGFKKDRGLLNEYLTLLSTNQPSADWSKEESMAFWINAYNAFTVDLILKHYPLKSINEIKVSGKKPWDISFIKIGGNSYTLNNIEHDILRAKYKDPRIHFAVNCASISCPLLYDKAFTAESLNSQLNRQAERFINDSQRNKISNNSAQLSKIFEWFKSDFEQKGSLVDFLNQYSKTKLSSSARISYLNYNWNLNNQ